MNTHEYCDDCRDGDENDNGENNDGDNGKVDNEDRGRHFGSEVTMCKESRFNTMAILDDGGNNDVLHSVFLRDPLKRLLSGYLDKCVKPNNQRLQGHCELNAVIRINHVQWKEGKGATNDDGNRLGGRASISPTT